jgi:hypothetical protein
LADKLGAFRKPMLWAAGLGAGVAGAAWFFRGWQPLTDIDCARLTAPVPGEPQLVERISSAALRRDTTALASIRPRQAGSPGEALARDWVATRFREAGLRGVRLQAVPYPRWQGEGGRLTLLEPPAQELPCLVLNGSAATPSEGIKALLVDVSTGQPADYERLEADALQGRIHLAWGGSLHRRDICANAASAGAAAVIIAHPDPDPVGGTGDTYLVENGTAVVRGPLPVLAVSHPVGQRLREAAQRGAPARLNVSSRYTLGYGYNVVGEIPGQSRNYVALIAHYDAWYGGAADNAASVAGMLALARAWAGLAPPACTLRLISTTAEEEGLMGALADVVLRAPQVKARCRGVVSLELVGAPGETLWATGWPPQVAGAAAAIARGLGYEAATGNGLNVFRGRIYGDHWPYTLLRIPGVLLVKYPYRYYHTPYDTPDRLDYADARYHTAAAGSLVWRLAHL